MGMDSKLIDHAAQFAAAFDLIAGAGLQEQENVIKRQIDSFMVVEGRHDKAFPVRDFVQCIVSLIPCTVTARNVWIDCCPDSLKVVPRAAWREQGQSPKKAK